MPIINWTSELLKAFTECFPFMTNNELAVKFGFSASTVKIKAKQLGLKKAPRKASEEIKAIIRENFNNCSFAELAILTRRPKTQIVRIAKEMGLARNSETNRAIRSRVRNNIIRHERIRMKLGFAPLTRIRLSSDY